MSRWLGTEKPKSYPVDQRYLSAVAFSPNGKYLAAFAADDGTLTIRDMASGKDVAHWRWDLHDDKGRRLACQVACLAFSPDSALLAVTAGPFGADLIEVPSWRRRERVLTEPCGDIVGLAFSPDGTLLAAVSQVGNHHFAPPSTLYLCDVKTGTSLRSVGLERPVYGVAFSIDGKSVATGSGQQVFVHEVATLGIRVQFPFEYGPAHYSLGAPSFSRDGRFLSIANQDGKVRLWDLSGFSPLTEARAHLSNQQLATSWASLAGRDSGEAYRAIRVLADAPGDTIPYLRSRLRVVTQGQGARIPQLIRDLSARQFAVREAATAALSQLGSPSRRALESFLRRSPAPEARDRASQILKEMMLQEWNADLLRSVRSIETLELIGSPEARAVLASLAEGYPDALLTQQATASTQRLRRRPLP